YAKEERLHRACKCQRTSKPDGDADEYRAHSLAQNHREDFAGAGAESHAHTNLARAAADGIGHHAKKGRRSEQQRRNSKEADEDDIKATRAERSRIDLRESAESRRNIRVEIVQDAPRPRGDHLRVRIAEHGYGNRGAGTLEQIDVDGGLGR